MTKEYDIYRDSYIRYLGYANEVGEAFRPLINRNLVTLSYGISISYCLADVHDKSIKDYHATKDVKRALILAGDVLIWQMLASVAIPGYTINRITNFATVMVRRSKMNKKAKDILPTLIGLTSIPFIIKPIDHFVDMLLDNTYRKIF